VNDNSGLYYNYIVLSPEVYDPFEKDNAPSKGPVIALNTTTERSINPIGDIDFMNFECLIPYDVIIEITDNVGDSYLELYDEIQLVASDDKSGTGELSRISMALDVGNYTIKISEDGNDSTLSRYNITLVAFEQIIVPEYTILLGALVTNAALAVMILFSKKKKAKKV